MFKIKLYTEGQKCKNIFVKPTLHCYLGKGINDPCLPVWRNGPKFYLVKNKDIAYYPTKQKSYKAYRVINSIQIKTGVKESTLNGKPYIYDVYTTLRHKLPNGLRGNELVWNRNIRKKLRKFGLGWLKPSYELPRIFSFHIFNRDIRGKIKYEDICYEFPPQFTIVLFGISLSFGTTFLENRLTHFYYEVMLNYNFYKNDKYNSINEKIALKNFIKDMSFYYRTENDKKIAKLIVDKNFIVPEKQYIGWEAFSEIKRDNLNYIFES